MKCGNCGGRIGGWVWIVVVAAVLIVALRAGGQDTNGAKPRAAWDAHVERFLDEHFAAHPDEAVKAGRHEFDGQLPDWSAAGLRREVQRLKAERERTAAFKDEELSAAQRFERDYLLEQIEGDLFWLEVAERPYVNPSYYSSALDPDVYVAREYAPLETRIKAYTAYLRNVPRALEAIKANLRQPMARPLAKIGRQSIGNLADFFATDGVAIFAAVTDEALQKELRSANEAAVRAVREFDAWLAVEEERATADFALGPEKFGKMLAMTEGVNMPLGRLEALGRQDLERNQAALREACGKFAPGKSVAECMAIATARKPKEDPVTAARNQLGGLREFVLERDLVTIPGSEEALVDEAPSYRRWNFAYITIPGPYEKNLPSVYYIAPPDPSWPKEVQDNYVPSEANLLYTSAHEVYPGHFLQYLHANRARSKVGRVFVGYAFSEGWAHYAEEMMYEAGLGADNPEMHIGQLQDALLRNVRYLAAIGLHTQGMTVEQAKQMFINEAYQDEGNAQQQAERGTFDPAYLNYTLGKLMIRKLRDDWTLSRGGRAAWKEFHDKFLSYGGPPIPLIRRAMMGAEDTGNLF